jgi:uncharacterized protein
LLWALLAGEMCVCDVAAFLGVPIDDKPSLLALPAPLDLVINRRSGPTFYYRLRMTGSAGCFMPSSPGTQRQAPLIMSILLAIIAASWEILLASSIYILLGLLVGGLLKVFLSPAYVADLLGRGRYSSVLKATLIGIPLPLCSCGVPARRRAQEAGGQQRRYCLFHLHPGIRGGFNQHHLCPTRSADDRRPAGGRLPHSGCRGSEGKSGQSAPAKDGAAAPRPCRVDGCYDGIDCPPAAHANHHSLFEKIGIGLKYAMTDLWGDLPGWFFAGLLLGGIITDLVPKSLITSYLGAACLRC